MTKNELQNIVYLGPQGSYTEIAAEYLMGKSDTDKYNRVLKSSILQVIEAVDNNEGNIAVVPVENSIEGIVRESIDNLLTATSRVVILEEVIVPISHCLISKAKNIAEIENVISKPEAIAQCRKYIDANLNKNVEKVSAQSTSEAVNKLVNLPETFAAIGTAKAAKINNLNILATNINDEKDNLTRFIFLGSKVSPKTGNDKTSIAFSACNKPGALVEILNMFKENNLNLSYIESRPSRKVFGDYTFFIDFDGHIEDSNVQMTIGKMAPMINFYKFFGSYPKAKIINTEK